MYYLIYMEEKLMQIRAVLKIVIHNQMCDKIDFTIEDAWVNVIFLFTHKNDSSNTL